MSRNNIDVEQDQWTHRPITRDDLMTAIHIARQINFKAAYGKNHELCDATCHTIRAMESDLDQMPLPEEPKGDKKYNLYRPLGTLAFSTDKESDMWFEIAKSFAPYEVHGPDGKIIQEFIPL